MASTQGNITALTDHLFRHESGKMVAVLVKIFGTEHLQMAEDVVQDTLLRALETWKETGLPDNPPAWLYRVAKNKAVDIIRHNKFSKQYDFSDSERVLLQSEYTLAGTMNEYWQEEHIQDDLLRMMYACCDPRIAPENQVTLILKTLCGFSTAEIARSFVCPEDTVSKRLYRTREFFRENRIKPEFPPADELRDRTDAVLRSIYLLFNEGYNTTNADTHVRKDLIEQAMYLCSLLCHNHHTTSSEAYAAMALMYFHAARTDARTNESGEIILLAQQDRSKWNKQWIQKGLEYMGLSSYGDTVSSYHIEAAIAQEHCIAPTFEDTNWLHILQYYDWLMLAFPSHIAAINRLMVVFKVHGPQAALQEIEQTADKSGWEQHYLYHSLLGEVYAGTDKPLARACYERAARLTRSAAEQKLLARKITALDI